MANIPSSQLGPYSKQPELLKAIMRETESQQVMNSWIEMLLIGWGKLINGKAPNIRPIQPEIHLL